MIRGALARTVKEYIKTHIYHTGFSWTNASGINDPSHGYTGNSGETAGDSRWTIWKGGGSTSSSTGLTLAANSLATVQIRKVPGATIKMATPGTNGGLGVAVYVRDANNWYGFLTFNSQTPTYSSQCTAGYGITGYFCSSFYCTGFTSGRCRGYACNGYTATYGCKGYSNVQSGYTTTPGIASLESVAGTVTNIATNTVTAAVQSIKVILGVRYNGAAPDTGIANPIATAYLYTDTAYTTAASVASLAINQTDMNAFAEGMQFEQHGVVTTTNTNPYISPQNTNVTNFGIEAN